MESKTPRPRASAPHRQGLTLIDVTLTVMIIGLLAAVGIPRFARTLDTLSAKAAAQRVATDLRRARQHAKMLGTSQAIVFNTVDHTYELTGMHGLDRPGQAYRIDLTKSPYSAALSAVSFGALGTGTTVVFDRYGRPDYSGSVTVTAGGQQRIIRLDGGLGSVSIH